MVADRVPGELAGRAPPAGRVVSPALVGRAAELAALVSAVSSAPAVVSVEGEAGVGKTRLVAELLADPVAAGRRVLVGRSHPIRESFPLGPVIEAVRGVGAELAGLELGVVAGALRGLLPELAAWLPAAPEPLGDRAAERHRVFRGLVGVLAAVGPAVLVLEDLHWADEQTTDFVAYLLSDPPAGLVVLVTYRGERVDAAVRALTARPAAAVARAQLVLAPLDRAGTGALAGAILGVDQVSAEFAGYLWEHTAGLPFAVEEVLALVRAKGQLLPGRAGGWTRRGLAELEVPAAIRDSTLELVARLPPGARRLAEAAAVLQTPVPAAVLLDVARRPAPATAAGPDAAADGNAGDGGTAEGAGWPGGAELDEAVGSGLLVEQGGSVGFRHLLAAQAVYAALPWSGRRELHDRAATALRELPPVPLGQVAHHLRLAGRVGDWTDAAERAAAQAVELGHDEEAVRLLGDVLRQAPLDRQRRGRVAVLFGRAAIESLHATDAAELLTQVVGQDLPRPARGELQLYQVVLMQRAGGGLGRLRPLLIDAVDALAHRPDLRAWAMVSLGIVSAPDVPVAEDVRWLHRAVELVAGIDDPVRVFVLGKASATAVEVGDPSWRGLADRAVQITGAAPRLRLDVIAYHSIGMAASCAGHLDVADLVLTRALTAPAAQENRRLAIMVRSGLAMLGYARGQWDGLAAEVEALLDELDDFAIAGVDVAAVAGCLALARGDLAEADRRLRATMRLLGEVGGYGFGPLAAAAAARLALARGEPGAAVEPVRAVLASLRAKDAWAPVCRLLPAAVEALTAAAEPAEAAALVRSAGLALADRDAPLAPAALAHASGLLAAAGGDHPAAARQLVSAVERYQPLSCPYEAAQAGEAAASSLVAAGDDRAGAVLRAALASYQRLGATWDADRAASLARRHGIELPARHGGGRPSYGTELSPRERQVAELAAGGRTNKEIGQQLFLSPNTVDKHMRAVLRKLGARSRAGVGQRLAMPISPADTGKDGGLSP